VPSGKRNTILIYVNTITKHYTSGMPVNSGDVNETCSNDISKETNDVGEELHLFVERPRSPAAACFWRDFLRKQES
jgi:hypothetical protein